MALHVLDLLASPGNDASSKVAALNRTTSLNVDDRRRECNLDSTATALSNDTTDQECSAKTPPLILEESLLGWSPALRQPCEEAKTTVHPDASAVRGISDASTCLDALAEYSVVTTTSAGAPTNKIMSPRLLLPRLNTEATTRVGSSDLSSSTTTTKKKRRRGKLTASKRSRGTKGAVHARNASRKANAGNRPTRKAFPRRKTHSPNSDLAAAAAAMAGGRVAYAESLNIVCDLLPSTASLYSQCHTKTPNMEDHEKAIDNTVKSCSSGSTSSSHVSDSTSSLHVSDRMSSKEIHPSPNASSQITMDAIEDAPPAYASTIPNVSTDSEGWRLFHDAELQSDVLLQEFVAANRGKALGSSHNAERHHKNKQMSNRNKAQSNLELYDSEDSWRLFEDCNIEAELDLLRIDSRPTKDSTVRDEQSSSKSMQRNTMDENTDPKQFTKTTFRSTCEMGRRVSDCEVERIIRASAAVEL